MLYSKIAIAQDPNHFIIGEEDLAGVHVYTLLYDDDTEILYVGSDNGIYVYRQNQFIHLEKPKVANGNSFFSLQKNNAGEIFCSNLTGQVFKVNEDSYKLFVAFPTKEIESYFSFGFDAYDDIIAISKNAMKYSVQNDSIVVIDGSLERKYKKPYITLSKLSNNSFFFVTTRNSPNLVEYKKDGEFSIHKVKNLLYRGVFSMGGRTILYTNEGDYIDLNDSKKFINNVSPKPLERSSSIDENSILAMGRNNGFRIITLTNNTLETGSTYFPKEIISSFCQSSEKCFFFGTFGNGIKVVPSLKTLKQVVGAQLAGITTSPNNKVTISSLDGEIYEHTNETKLIAKLEQNIDQIHHIPFQYFGAIRKNIVYNSLFAASGIKDLEVIDSESILSSNGSNILLYTYNKNLYSTKYLRVKPNIPSPTGVYVRQILPFNTRVNSIAMDFKNECVYYITKLSTFKIDLNSDRIDTIRFNGKPIQSDFVEFYEGQLLCATKNHGILIFENDQYVKAIRPKDGLISTAIKKMQAKNGILYILTTKGIQIYDLEQEKFRYTGIAEGIVNNSKTVNFSISKNLLWLLEKNGFYSIPIEKNPIKNKVSKLYIDSIIVNGEMINWSANNSFSYDQNSMVVSFDYRNLLSKNETTISFTLDGFYDDWRTIPATENKIEFQSLPPGEYTFRIKATYRGQETKTFTYHFIVHPPYWQTLWFYGIILLIVIIGVFIFVKIRLKRQKAKMELINQANASKLTAIQSQMNPHFIFNALNSIQALVLKGDINNSYTYINQFSKLVRKTLNYSKLDFIEIESEIKLLEIYLSLEKMRFREDFEYTIEAPDFDEISVPPMLIQPFVENAFLHGLMHKYGLKKITIRFEVTDVITCIVEDNGVGRAAAKVINERQRSDHESFAIESIATRLEILSKHSKIPLGFHYEDLIENGEPSGTRVILRIPYIMNSY